MTLRIPFTGANNKSLLRHIENVDLIESFENLSDEYKLLKILVQ